MSSSRDDRFYGTVGKSRRTPPAGDPQGSIFFQGQGGRTVLPPLSSAFPSSRFPVPASYANQFTQPRSSPGRFDINPQALYNQWPSNISSAQPTSSFTNYEHERYTTQASYIAYPSRSSPPLQSNPVDSRKLPPLATASASTGERWTTSPSYIPTSSNYPTTVRSPPTAYQSTYTTYSTGNQPNQATAYSYQVAVDPHAPHAQSIPSHTHTTFEEMPRAPSPYSRGGTSHVPAPTYAPPPASPTSAEEPAIKKKRKRADAAQLKVLNETYNRTAFPSTEERLNLAKTLDMSARSVQIWFQNKRQSMRQTNRQSTTVSPSSHQPFSVPGQQDSMDDMTHNTTSGGYNGSGLTMSDSYMSRSLPDASRSHTSQQPSSSHRRMRNQEEVVDPRKWSHGY